MLRTTPFPSKFQINVEEGGRDRYWSKTTRYDDLLLAHGQHVKTYADISHLAKGFTYARLGMTESEALTPFYEYLVGEGGTEIVDKNYARWRIYGEPDRRCLSLGNTNSGDYSGQGGLPFELWLSDDYYRAYDILAPIENKRVQLVVEDEEPVPYDGGFLYQVRLLDDSEDAFVEDYLFDNGMYYIKMGALDSWEKTGTAGSIQFGEGFAYVEFEVPLTTMTWSFEIEGEAHRQFGNLEVMRCDDDGRPIPGESKITNYHEVRANAQIEMEKEYFLAWGTQTERLLNKKTGKAMTTGPGLFEYLEYGNIIPYNPSVSGIDFMVEQLEALWFDRVPFAQREVVFWTGQAGLKLFSQWVQEKFGDTAAQYGYDFVLKSRPPYDKTGGRDGYAYVEPQFVEYVLPTFGTIKVAHWPILDNTRISGVTYPNSIYPATSYEFVAMNVGFGEPNMKMLGRVDNKIQTYIPGLWSPFGATGQDNPVFKTPAYMEESYKWLHRESFGMVVMDPSVSMWFKPNIDY